VVEDLAIRDGRVAIGTGGKTWAPQMSIQSLAVTTAGNNGIPGPASAGFGSKAHIIAGRRLMPRAAVGPRNAPGCAAKRSATSRLDVVRDDMRLAGIEAVVDPQDFYERITDGVRAR
jgi:hypothetical protein